MVGSREIHCSARFTSAIEVAGASVARCISSTGSRTSRAVMSDPMASQRASGCHGTRIKMTEVTATDAPYTSIHGSR